MDHMNQKKPGRPKIYKTEKNLKKRVEDYFASISYVTPVLVNGEPVMNQLGKPMTQLCYSEPPTFPELCLYLGISKRTWGNYESDYPDVCEDAKLRIEAYLNRELDTRDRTDGIRFDLQNNYDKATKVQVGVTTPMSLADRKRLIEEAARQMKEDMGDAEEG